MTHVTSVDTARRRLRVRPADLRALARIRRAEVASEAGETPVAELVAAGLLAADGGVVPLVDDLARCSERPSITFTVELLGEQGLSIAHVVVSGEDVWASDPWPVGVDSEEAVVWERSELTTIVWTLGRLVGLHRATPPTDAAPLSAPLATVSGFLATLAGTAALGEADWTDARTTAIATASQGAARLAPGDHEQWIAMLATVISSWRITAQWGPVQPDVTPVRGLAVLDCGPRGYWERLHPVEPVLPEDLSDATVATYAPVSGGEVWARITSLLPSSDELRAAYATELSGSSDVTVTAAGAQR